MAVSLGSNISSLRGIRQLRQASDATGKIFERLSSELRVNKASDSANCVRGQFLQQSGIAIRAQANTQPTVALSLLS